MNTLFDDLALEIAFDLKFIREFEMKMLPSPSGRDRNDSPKKCLTREEQLIYADYLEASGQPLSAAYFRKEEK